MQSRAALKSHTNVSAHAPSVVCAAQGTWEWRALASGSCSARWASCLPTRSCAISTGASNASNGNETVATDEAVSRSRGGGFRCSLRVSRRFRGVGGKKAVNILGERKARGQVQSSRLARGSRACPRARAAASALDVADALVPLLGALGLAIGLPEGSA